MLLLTDTAPMLLNSNTPTRDASHSPSKSAASETRGVNHHDAPTLNPSSPRSPDVCPYPPLTSSRCATAQIGCDTTPSNTARNNNNFCITTGIPLATHKNLVIK